jgi:uncharacterized protein YdbL (DUF1318 family)
MTLLRYLAALLAAVLSLPGFVPGRIVQAQADGPPRLTLEIGANFYPPEVWAPGRVRRWMANDGELLLVNDAEASQSVNLRFYAEAFRVVRHLEIAVDGRRVAQWEVQPNAERYVVARRVRLAPGRHRIVFHTPQAPASPASVGQGSDPRPLSVAFSPFSIIDADAPEARTDWTAPFAAGPAGSRYFTPQENAAHYLRRQGRLAEAARGYESALRADGNEAAYLFYGMTLLALDRRADAQRTFQQCAGLARARIRLVAVPDLCRRGAAYLGQSRILSQGADPGRRARADGRIGDALEAYRGVIAGDADAIVAHDWLGIIYALAERRAEARVHLDRVIVLTGDSADGRFLTSLRPYL